jgi:hypothetical protein
MVDRRLLGREAHGVTVSPIRGIQRSDSPTDQGENRPGFRVIPLVRKQKPLIDILGEGQRIALKRTVGKNRAPIVLHDPTGIIKPGNPNVRVLDSK